MHYLLRSRTNRLWHLMYSFMIAFVPIVPIAFAAPALAADQQGSDLLDHCANGCHRAYKASEFNQDRWQRIMNSMIHKTKLPPDQVKLLREYVAKHTFQEQEEPQQEQ